MKKRGDGEAHVHRHARSCVWPGQRNLLWEVEEVREGRGEESEDAGGDPISAIGSEAAQCNAPRRRLSSF